MCEQLPAFDTYKWWWCVLTWLPAPATEAVLKVVIRLAASMRLTGTLSNLFCMAPAQRRDIAQCRFLDQTLLEVHDSQKIFEGQVSLKHRITRILNLWYPRKFKTPQNFCTDILYSYCILVLLCTYDLKEWLNRL